MDTEDRTYAQATAALSLLTALEARPVRTLRPDGRYELRYLEIVLMEAPDRRLEFYQIDPADGLEMFQGYLNDPKCPRRVEMLRLWMEGHRSHLRPFALQPGYALARQFNEGRVA